MYNKVWFVGQGEYSDSHAVGVLSSEDAAKRAAEVLPDGWYREFILDAEILAVADRPGMLFYSATIYLNDGRIFVMQDNPAEESLMDKSATPEWHTYGVYNPYLYVTMWARDEEHATKIAAEKRQAWLRESGWVRK